MANLAIASWPLGEVDRAMSLIDAMETRIVRRSRIMARQFWTNARGAVRIDALATMFAARRALSNSLRLAHEHEMPLWGAFAVFLEGWASAASGEAGGGLDGMRRGVDSLRAQNILNFDGLVKIALARTEAEAGDPGRAVAILDDALATADRVGHRAFEAELHRARGEILLKRDAANPAPAEDAFLTAIAVAKQQGARSFELRAALSLAKLYRSTARPAEAHAVLAPAIEGFAPTTAMPEIAEAQALLDCARRRPTRSKRRPRIGSG